MPAGQAVQEPAPAREYWPAGQMDTVALVDPAGHVYPAAHNPTQPAVAWPPTSPYRPALHGPVHVARAMAVEAPCLPAGQGVHAAAPARENCPAGHVVWVADALPAGQAYLEGGGRGGGGR